MAGDKWSLSSLVSDNETAVRRAFVGFYSIGAVTWAIFSSFAVQYFLERINKGSNEIGAYAHPAAERFFTLAVSLFCVIAVMFFFLQVIAAFSILRKANYLICFLSIASLCIPVNGVWPMLFGFLGFAFFTALPLPARKSRA